MTSKRVIGALRDMWWVLVVAVVGAVPVWLYLEPFVACFMPPLALATVLYFAVFRYDDEGRERSEL